MIKEDKDLNEVCSWLLKNVKDNTRIRQPTKGGMGFVIWVHSKIVRAMKMYAKKYAEKKLKEIKRIIHQHERKIQRLETQVKKVPCSIKPNSWCEEPFCKFTHYSYLMKEAKREWMIKIREELESYKKEKKCKEVKGNSSQP